jgi:hypothetical protein
MINPVTTVKCLRSPAVTRQVRVDAMGSLT